MAESFAGWNHNVHYHDFLLRQLPARVENVLDVGCGHGLFAQRLASCAERVDALDVDPQSLQIARSQTRSSNLRFIEGDFLTVELPEQHYDAITLVASLHHMDLSAALHRAKRLLTRDGTLLVLGLYRERSLLDFAYALAAVPVSIFYKWRNRPTHPRAIQAPPTLAPNTSLKEIRAIAAAVLPGAKIRRHLLWRYSLVWRPDGAT